MDNIATAHNNDLFKFPITGAERVLNFIYFLGSHEGGFYNIISQVFLEVKGQNFTDHVTQKMESIIGDDNNCRPAHIIKWMFQLNTHYQMMVIDWVNENYDHKGSYRKTAFTIEGCVWGNLFKTKTVNESWEISGSHDYTNGCHGGTRPTDLNEAIRMATKLHTVENSPQMSDENRKYWNDQSEVITKVTTIREVVNVVESHRKFDQEEGVKDEL